MKLSVKVQLTEEEIRSEFERRIRPMVGDLDAEVTVEWPSGPSRPPEVVQRAAPVKNDSDPRQQARELYRGCALTVLGLTKALNGAVSGRTVSAVLSKDQPVSDVSVDIVLKALKAAPRGPKERKAVRRGHTVQYNLGQKLKQRGMTPYALSKLMAGTAEEQIRSVVRKGYCRTGTRDEIEAALKRHDASNIKHIKYAPKPVRPQVGDVTSDGRTIKSVAQRSDGVWMYRVQSNEGHMSLPITEEELMSIMG
jgi:hypothetical protein